MSMFPMSCYGRLCQHLVNFSQHFFLFGRSDVPALLPACCDRLFQSVAPHSLHTLEIYGGHTS